MRKPVSYFRGGEGTIMIFALVIILGGTLVLAGWAQMMATRATYTVMTGEGLKRRIAMENGHALARQYVLTQMPSGSVASTNYSLTNDWGGFSINFASGFWTNTNYAEGNPFNPISGSSFAITNYGTISNAVEAYNWTFIWRTRSPLLAGFPVVLHYPVDPGNSQFSWVTNAAVIFSNNIMTNRPSNASAPKVSFTSGTNASATNGYIGYFASPLNTNYSFVSVTEASLSITNGGSNGASFVSSSTNANTNTTNYSGGTVTLILNSTQTNPILRYDSPTNTVTNVFAFTNVSGSKTIIRRYSNAAVTNLTLVGTTNTNCLHIIVDSSNPSLSTVVLSGSANSRRIYLNWNATNDLALQTATTSTNYVWALGMTVSNTNGNFTITAPSSGTNRLTLQGGLRTDRTSFTLNGNLSAATNPNPLTNMELIPDRILWLEEQRTP